MKEDGREEGEKRRRRRRWNGRRREKKEEEKEYNERDKLQLSKALRRNYCNLAKEQIDHRNVCWRRKV